ncbi:hypothetical protein K7432_005545 [Basidiobolus ranarum]|uniref:Uncharacterized protein n=1 Tax=Basidiobolus ranarum TaxID=34480 RepID=A0ABR2WWH5_9FUNG
MRTANHSELDLEYQQLDDTANQQSNSRNQRELSEEGGIPINSNRKSRHDDGPELQGSSLSLMTPIETHVSRTRGRRNSHTPLINSKVSSVSPSPSPSVNASVHSFSLLAGKTDKPLPLSFSSSFHRRGVDNDSSDTESDHRNDDSSDSEEELTDDRSETSSLDSLIS